MPHQYPGVDLPLRHFPQGYDKQGVTYYRIGAHPNCSWTTTPLLMVREVAMLVLMDRLTDKPDWHEKVFDEDIVDKWRQEALTQPEDMLYAKIIDGKRDGRIPKPQRTRLISEKCFDYCISEMRNKAAYFKKTGLVITLDSDINNVVKSDGIVTAELHQALRASFNKLHAAQAADPDWHPWTDNKVQDLVHPSMYPFIYGQSKFLQEEVVGVSDAVEKWAGKGDVIAKSPAAPQERNPWRLSNTVPAEYWSNTYQWLPANLAFQEDGTVMFTSYINNLHPKKHPEIYAVIEKLVDTAIPAWDYVLTGQGRSGTRFDLPPEVDEDNNDEMWEQLDTEIIRAVERDEGPIAIEEDEIENFFDPNGDDDDEQEGVDEENITSEEEDDPKTKRIKTKLKWEKIRDPLLTQPVDFESTTYSCAQNIRDKFKDSGLQVIVKMASIELTPAKPVFPVGGWHIEGQVNERIVATALYYLDSENVTPSFLSFRMQTAPDQLDLMERTGQDMYHYYERLYGTSLGAGSGGSCLQNFGDVETRQGRLLAFPNVFQHRVSPFTLQDPSKPGHRRFIALWLVDPHQHIISTANVPPQQLDWWAEAVFSTQGAAKGEMPPEVLQLLLEQGAGKNLDLPREKLNSLAGGRLTSRLSPEIMNMIRGEGAMAEGLITVEEAKQHRVKLMEERSIFHKQSDSEWRRNQYSFCEH